ncbi:MAG: gamma-glutamyltransferase [Gammaproteobacteria bacterium]
MLTRGFTYVLLVTLSLLLAWSTSPDSSENAKSELSLKKSQPNNFSIASAHPLAATREMYLDVHGEVTNQSVKGPLAAGIPGTPAAIAHIANNYGQLPLQTSLNAAINLARSGFLVSEFYNSRASAVVEHLKSFPQTAELFLQGGEVPQTGYVLKQPDLGNVLEKISEYGADGFYRGKIAVQLVSSVQKAGGIWQLRDLHNYQIVERQPVIGKYKNIEIISAALPSSGGIVLMQILNMLAQYDLQSMSEDHRKHVIVEAMRRAYHDRALYLGDIDFIDVPVEELLSAEHAEKRFADFSMQHATPSQQYIQQEVVNSQPLIEEAQNTTHFSVLDREGNYVAATLSINYYFGSGFVVEGTGVLLNNEMDDFAIQPGRANLWGLVGSEANAIEPGKRMLSSMSPTFLNDGQRIAILGTPGGSRIISMVLLSTLAFGDGAKVMELVQLPRFHHQFLPDQIQFESDALTVNTQHTLKSMGHELKDLERSYGNMHAIIWNQQTNNITAASDPRGIGKAQVGVSQR